VLGGGYFGFEYNHIASGAMTNRAFLGLALGSGSLAAGQIGFKPVHFKFGMCFPQVCRYPSFVAVPHVTGSQQSGSSQAIFSCSISRQLGQA
jgi:hypothetical protein